jgi:hypothetical protein
MERRAGNKDADELDSASKGENEGNSGGYVMKRKWWCLMGLLFAMGLILSMQMFASFTVAPHPFERMEGWV